MKKIIRKILLLWSQESEKEVFENKIFNIVTFVGAFTCFFSIIINIFITSSFLVNLIIGIIGIIFCAFFYLSFFRGIVKPLIIPFQILGVLGLTLSWIYFQGIEGSTPFFFFIAVNVFIFSNSNRKYGSVLFIYISFAIMLIGIHYLFPEWIINYDDEISRRNDLSLSFIIALFLLGYATLVLKKNFDLERSKTEQKNKELYELNATKDKFFSIISHDLKSPFNSIIGFSNLLIEQVKEKDYEGIEEYAKYIQDSSQRAMNLLLNLLEWSRSQTGRMEYNPEYVEIDGPINEVIELLSDSAQQKSITIHREFPRNMLVFIDKAMISTIMRNLISNAIKFTNPGGEIIISVIQNQKEMIVSVADNGVGIRPMMIDKLFRIDESSSTSGTQDELGTGLGLILCKEFVEKHGGKIRVESDPDGKSGRKGSKFSFTIPKS